MEKVVFNAINDGFPFLYYLLLLMIVLFFIFREKLLSETFYCLEKLETCQEKRDKAVAFFIITTAKFHEILN